MKRTVASLVFALSTLTLPVLAQVTNITFDHPLTLPAATQLATNQYTETGFLFKPLGVLDGASIVLNSGDMAEYPDDGTQFLQTQGVASLEFYPLDGAGFDLLSVDLAEYSTNFAFPKTVTFVGFLRHGQIEQTFTTDGVIDGSGPLADFQTFKFDRRWTKLQRVQIKSDFYSLSLDNLVIQKRSSRFHTRFQTNPTRWSPPSFRGFNYYLSPRR